MLPILKALKNRDTKTRNKANSESILNLNIYADIQQLNCKILINNKIFK